MKTNQDLVVAMAPDILAAPNETVYSVMFVDEDGLERAATATCTYLLGFVQANDKIVSVIRVS